VPDPPKPQPLPGVQIDLSALKTLLSKDPPAAPIPAHILIGDLSYQNLANSRATEARESKHEFEKVLQLIPSSSDTIDSKGYTIKQTTETTDVHKVTANVLDLQFPKLSSVSGYLTSGLKFNHIDNASNVLQLV